MRSGNILCSLAVVNPLTHGSGLSISSAESQSHSLRAESPEPVIAQIVTVLRISLFCGCVQRAINRLEWFPDCSVSGGGAGSVSKSL